MSLNLVNKKFNIKQNEYLLDCDLINKYSLKSLYKKPKIKKINIHFPLDSFSNANTVDSNVQVKSMLLFYTFFSLISYINFKKIKVKKVSKNITDVNFSLKIVLSDIESIYFFLFNLMVENFNRLEKDEIKLFDKNYSSIKNKNDFQHTVSIPAKTFFDMDDFFSKHIKDIDLKSFNLSINLIFKNFNECKNKNKLIKNISFFWINKY
jgi:hypothetical protein